MTLTKKEYNYLLHSGMFWEWFPDCDGEYEKDKLKIRCGNYWKYKGIVEPTCNGGVPCHSCKMKYHAIQNRGKYNV